MKRLFPVFLSFLFGSVLFSAEYPLVSNGKSNAVIQQMPRPGAPEFDAAVELQTYLRKITGVDFRRSCYPAVFTRTVENPGLLEILVVTLENGRRLVPPEMAAKLESAGDQAFYIRTAGPRIIIAGKKPIGALYGAYTFLEKYLNVRWFHPGPEGEVVPRKADVTLPEIDLFEEPDVRHRIISTWKDAAKPWSMEEVELWMRRNKMHHGAWFQYPDRSREDLARYEGGNALPSGGGHLTFEQAVPRRLFKTDPELFQFKNGKWVCEERSQRCLSNPRVKRMVADYVAEMARYGGRYSISYHDSTDGWCMCPGCIAMGTVNGKFSIPDLAHRFSSEIAGEVYRQVPDAELSVDMYSQFRSIPSDKTIHYDKRLGATYCPHQRCYVHPFAGKDSDCNKRFHEEFESWRKLYPKIGIFDYYCSARSPYAPFEYVFAEDAKFYKKVKLDTWIEDCTYADVHYLHSNWTFYYVASKLLWDADQDVEKLMDELCTMYYGKASAPMKRYQRFRRELWESAPGHALYGGPNRIGYCLSSPEAEKRLRASLAEARQLAGGDKILLKRIAIDEDNLNLHWKKAAEKVRAALSGQNYIPVAARAGEIRIDGRLDEDAWRKAPLVPGFLGENRTEPAEETRVKVLYDENNWYIGIEAMTEHAWSKLKADAKNPGDPVWTDDSVEIFIAPPGGDYFHWIVNSIGTMYQARMRDASFRSGAEVKTSAGKDRYSLEIRIPAEKLGARILPGQAWQMHFYRTMTNLQPPKNSAWASLDATQPHDQIAFRRVFPGTNVFTNGDFSESVPKNPNDKGVLSERFPKGWGGSGVAMVPGENKGNRVRIRNGYLLQWLNFGQKPGKQRFSGEIRLSGKAEIWLSGCSREPGNRKPFGHEIRRDVLKTAPQSAEFVRVPFTVEIGPFEQGYFYVAGEDVVVDYVSGTLSSVPEK